MNTMKLDVGLDAHPHPYMGNGQIGRDFGVFRETML